MAENIRFPNVSFDWLGDLPATAIARQTYETKKQTLADLTDTSPEALSKKAGKLMAAGLLDEGMKLYGIATQRKAADQRTIFEQMQLEWLKKNIPGLEAKPPAENTGDVQWGGQPAAAPTMPPSGIPSAFPGPQSALQGAQMAYANAPWDRGQPPATALPPRGPLGPPNIPPAPRPAEAPVSPTESVLAAAQGGPVIPASGLQLAGPPPTPDTAAPPLSPETVRGAQATYGVVPPAQSPGPAGPMPMRPPIPADSPTAVSVAGKAMTMPPRSQGLPAFRVFMTQYTNELKKQNLSPEMQSYQLDQAQRAWEGLPVQNHAEWKVEVADRPKEIEAARDAYTKRYQPEEQKARDLQSRLGAITQVLNHPKFATSGPGSGLLDSGRRAMSAMVDTMQAAGINVPDSIKDRIKSINEPVALRELFSSLTAQLVVTSMGGLGVGRSDKDVAFMGTAYQSLANTKEGNKLIVKFMSEVTKRKAEEAQVARDYLSTRKTRATVYGLDQAVNDKIAPYSQQGILVGADGKLTDLGQQMQDELNKTPEPTVAPPPVGGPTMRGYPVSPRGY